MRPTLTWEMPHDLPLRPENVLVTGFEKLGGQALNNFPNIDNAVPFFSSLQRVRVQDSLTEIIDIINKLKPKSSSGVDDLSNKVIKTYSGKQ